MGAEGPVPGDSRSPRVRRGGARTLRSRADDARAHRAEKPTDGARRLRLLAGQQPTATTSSSTRTMRAATSCCGSTCCASRSRSPTAGRIDRSPISSRRDRPAPDYVGAFAVTAGIGADAARARVRAGQRRLQRDHRQGAGRSAGRGVRRVSARAGAQGLGLSRGRAAVA